MNTTSKYSIGSWAWIIIITLIIFNFYNDSQLSNWGNADKKTIINSLLDEIDKAPRELPNNLLFLLSERKIVIPETQQVISCEPGKMPVIVITSNHEQDLPAPFIRRCIYMYIEFPPPERMREIVRMHHPGANENMVKTAIEIFYQLRELNLTRKPSTGEILDWIAYLVRENIQSLKDIQRLRGAQTLVKHRDDRELLQLIQEKGISSASQVKSGRW